MDSCLRTWKLIATDTPSSLWSLSNFDSAAYVRAESPTEARLLAAQRFRKYATEESDSHQFVSPCLDPDLVHCIEAVDKRIASLPMPCVLTVSEVDAAGALTPPRAKAEGTEGLSATSDEQEELIADVDPGSTTPKRQGWMYPPLQP
jgi:hypothetical protein